MLQTLIWPIVRPLFWFFLHLEIRGRKNLTDVANTYGRRYLLKDKRRIIFAANHSSELDAVLIPASLPFLSPFMPMFYTSREQKFYRRSGWRQFLYGGFFFKLWGAHRLQSGRQDYETSLKTHIGLLEAGKSLIMFPDGKRLPEAEIGSYAHGGVGYLSWHTGAAVVPVRITGVFGMTLANFLLRRRFVEVRFGEPLFTANLFFSIGAEPTLLAFKAAAERIMDAVKRL